MQSVDSSTVRRIMHMLKQRYRRTQQPSDRQKWVEHERRHQVYRRKEQLYWSMLLSDHAGQPRKLWRSLNVLLGKNTTRGSTSNCPSAQQRLYYFIEKVAAVRRSTGSSEASTALPSWISSLPVLLMTFRKSSWLHLQSPVCCIRYQWKSSKCSYQNYFCTSQACATHRCLPQSQCHATVVLRVKKASAEQTDIKNYWPISNLT